MTVTSTATRSAGLPLRPGEVVAFLRSPAGTKLLRYSTASIVSLAVSVVCLVVFEGVLGWAAVVSSTLATAIATVPSYELNRKWAWGKTGRGHLWREVVPFWVTAFIGWGFSTICVAGIESWAIDHHYSHLFKTALVAVVYVAAFGVLWVGKFMFFNKVLFAHQRDAHQRDAHHRDAHQRGAHQRDAAGVAD